MEQYHKRGIISLLAGIGIIVLLIGIFTDNYRFMSGLVAAIGIWCVTVAFSRLIGAKEEPDPKKALLSLLSGAGFVILLAGLLTSMIDFFPGLITAISIWILTGVLGRFMNVKHERCSCCCAEKLEIPENKTTVKRKIATKKTMKKKTVKKKTAKRKTTTKKKR